METSGNKFELENGRTRMTRASQTTANIVRMSQVNQGRKNGSGGSYPQWMRTLEEKYQKLHKKITENTTIGYGRFNSCVGRTVYDARLSQALSRYKDLAFQKQHLKSKSTSKVGEINSNNEIGNVSKRNENLSEENQYLNNNLALDSDNESVNNCEENEITRSLSPKLSKNLNEEVALSENSSVNLEKDSDSVAENVCESNSNPNEELDTQEVHDSEICVISSDKHPTTLTGDSDKLNSNKYCRRNLKTSVSRTSKVTSKSCPAKIVSKALDKPHQKRLLSSRSKSANRNAKMFTPMSEEAKHAITETIHEMNHSTPGRTQRSEVNFIPSRGRKCVRTWMTPKKARSAFDVRKVLESASQCLEDLHSDGVNLCERNSADDDDSCHSSGGTLPDESNKLPDIQNGSARDRNNIRNSSYRLPGIGKYDIAQDTFEITPPGFDSRYNDMQVFEERESETPPPEIRQRAIDKCAEWLNKYNK